MNNCDVWLGVFKYLSSIWKNNHTKLNYYADTWFFLSEITLEPVECGRLYFEEAYF